MSGSTGPRLIRVERHWRRSPPWLSFVVRRKMSARISRPFLMAFFVLLLLSGFLLPAPGDYWPWYAITGTCALVATFLGPRWHRVVRCACVATRSAIAALLLLLLALVAFRDSAKRIVLPVRFNSVGTPTLLGMPLSHPGIRRSVFAVCGRLGLLVSVPADETQLTAVGKMFQELRAAQAEGIFRSPP